MPYTARTEAPTGAAAHIDMFDHLIAIQDPPTGFMPLADAPASAVLAAQVGTADWLNELGVPDDDEIDAAVQRNAARKAFAEVAVDPEATDEAKKQALAEVKTPEAVRHLVGMLSAYDWEFVEQASQLRGYVVAKIVEETKHPDARIRLKALQMLGNVTEVAAFTTRVEVSQPKMDEAEINERLQEKLKSYLERTVVAEATPALPDVDSKQ